MKEKSNKFDPKILAPLLASNGVLLAVASIMFLLAKPILTVGVLALVGRVTGKVVKRIEERRAI